MAIDTTAANTRGRNVEPLSSVLDMQTLDADCSAFTLPPEDGEFLFFNGSMEVATHASADLAIGAGDMGLGAQLCMVWSEVGRSDLQANGYQRVPVVFRKSFHCELALYNYDAAALPIAGELLWVQAAATAVNGDVGLTRLVASSNGLLDLSSGAGEHWVIGHVMKAPSAAGEPIEVLIYDTPRATTAT
jgi:hypothetical protein